MIALLIRDLRLAVRAGGGLGLGHAFFLIVVVLVPFGVGPTTELLSAIAPGILWVAALLADAGPVAGAVGVGNALRPAVGRLAAEVLEARAGGAAVPLATLGVGAARVRRARAGRLLRD